MVLLLTRAGTGRDILAVESSGAVWLDWYFGSGKRTIATCLISHQSDIIAYTLVPKHRQLGGPQTFSVFLISYKPSF
ncbi:hypothetical protein L6452_13611 [Arctium lappa]|uniref:Uncharacterized protein n=1 Tax=Arctium lappa TaxID=4217 RepID=A0ACB9CJ08_ARCLA|nr:hypothetical protein L6452_13611 [Arctium lappa]